MTDDYDIVNPWTSAALVVAHRRRALTERRVKVARLPLYRDAGGIAT
jgi:hypothetical protein